MNKKYGKLEESELVYAPDVLVADGKKIITPFEEDYLKAGYLPIVLGAELPYKEGYEIVESYRIIEEGTDEETTQHIERVQEYVKLPEIEPSESEMQQEAILQLAKIQAEEITDDEKALSAKALYDKWDGNGVEYKTNQYTRYKDDLYKVLQNHTSQADWTPDTAHSLYSVVGKPGEGTKEKPIEWKSGMIAEKDKYYVDEDVIYLCIEDSKIGLYGQPKDLARYLKSV